jgi:hypothetical protein
MNQTDKLPFIVILDWDNTIVGKVDYQSQKYSLEQHYKKFGLKVKKNSKVPKAFNKDSKLIRPYFLNFITELTDYFQGNIYFFIYTASERKWANTEISWLEKSHGIKFQRPIFTRDDCIVDKSGSYRKSISNIFPRMLRSMGLTKISKEQKTEILHQRLLIIDNNAVFNDMKEHLLICPDYNFMVFENLLEDIPLSYLQNPNIRQHILSLINMGLICPFFGKNDDINQQMYKKYEWLAIKCKHISENNTYSIKDIFFKYLTGLIVKNNLKIFTPNVIKQLQTLVWKKIEKKDKKEKRNKK